MYPLKKDVPRDISGAPKHQQIPVANTTSDIPAQRPRSDGNTPKQPVKYMSDKSKGA